MSCQVYGHFSDQGSLSQVSRAIVRRLRRQGLGGSVFQIKSTRPNYMGVKWSVGFDQCAAVGIYIDYPEASVGYLNGHQHKILVTVCETSRIPSAWVSACNAASLVVVPSEFCQRAFRESGVAAPIMVVPHGVPEFYEDLEPLTAEHVRGDGTVHLLHVSGAASFPWRKGTSQLLLAFREFLKGTGHEVKLHLRMANVEGAQTAIRRLGLVSSVFLDRFDEFPCTDVYSMSNYYRTFDAVVQPSRGEGFGIVPLEARCLGIPALLTAGTGHLQHVAPLTDVLVPVGRLEPMATQGNDVGSAPAVSSWDVKKGLVDLVDNLPTHKQRARTWAENYGRGWAWPRVLGPFAKEVARMAGDSEPMKLGQEAGLRGR